MRIALRRVSVALLGLALSFCATTLRAQTQTSKPKTSTSTSSKTHGTTTKASSRKKKDKGQMTPTPERITEIQQALAKDGSYSAAPSGKWDDGTVDAIGLGGIDVYLYAGSDRYALRDGLRWRTKASSGS